MFEASPYPANDHSIDLKSISSSEISTQENNLSPRVITARNQDDRRGKQPRNLYAVKVYDRRVSERRQGG